MSTATTDSATLDADRYLKDVAPHLAALPAEERADLLDDLAQHLREIAAEPGPPLVERLGPPEQYAAELLASAGVAVAGGAARTPLAARAGTVLARARASWVGQETVRLLPVLRPAWWVVRAYLAVSLLSSGSGTELPRPAGSPFLGLLAVLAAIPLSVRLGQRTLPRAGRLAVLGANAVLAVYGLSLLGGSGAAEVRYVDFSDDGSKRAAIWGCLADGQGERITNLYAYDAEGRLLDPVLLYDQNGRPVDNLCPEVDALGRPLSTEYRRDANGAPVINAFPRRQFAYTLPDATVPVRPPAVVVPRLAPTTTTTLPAPPTTAAPG